MKIRVFSVLFILFLSLASTGQQTGYYIRNYLPKEYKGFNQTWQVTQDQNGVLYVAGTSFIYAYTGQNWEPIQVKSGAANRQIKLNPLDSTIYIGAVGDFGYLKRDPAGKLKYHTLATGLDENQAAFADIWKVHIHNGCIYFQASERIFVVKNKKILDIIEPPQDKTFALSFIANGRLFVRQRTVGLMEIVDNKLVALPGNEIFSDMRLLGMLTWKEGKSLLLSGDQGFYVMDTKPDPETGSLFYLFSGKPDSFLVNSGVLGCSAVNDSVYIVNSRSGVGFFNKDLRRKEILNMSNGLSDESISEVFADREKNIWLTHNKGITRIGYNSPIRYYDKRTGYIGMLEQVLRFKGIIYIATSEGIFRQKPGPDPDKILLEPVGIPRTEAWSLFVFEDHLYSTTGQGLFRFDEKGSSTLLMESPMNSYSSSEVKNEFLIVMTGGFSYWRSEKPGSVPEMIFKADMPGFDLMRAGKVEVLPDGSRAFWCTSRFKTNLRITFNTITKEFHSREYDTVNGVLPEEKYILQLGDSVYYATNKDIWRYIPSKDKNKTSLCFFPAPDILNYLVSGKCDRLVPPINPRLFISKPRDLNTIFYGVDENDGTVFCKEVLMEHFYDDPVDFYYLEKNGMLWAGSTDNFIRYDLSKPRVTTSNFNTVLNAVIVGKDSVILFGSDKQSHSEVLLPYLNNTITFVFGAPYFDNADLVHFSCRLEGLDTSWTDWSRINEKTYSNLREGDYTFTVRGVNMKGEESKRLTYSFTILPPWYRSSWAYIAYIVLAIGLIYLIVKLSIRRLQQAKLHLEEVVRQRTNEVVEQKQMLEIAYKDIKDSIHYAQRIQESILPVQTDIRKMFPESFVLFQPRDIVSGDFYWFSMREKKSFIACVDCTGHGIPGAFMSMVGNTLLNEIVLENGIEAPANVLERLHLRVRQSLKQDAGSDTRDGMDIAFCVIDHAAHTLQFAGANRPLWIIRDSELIEIRPDKQSIGGIQTEGTRTFSNNIFALKDGDAIYLATDGYADQFGGPRGKKFMVKQLHEVLIKISSLTFDEQKIRLSSLYSDWKKNHEQVDDVLVIGFRYSV